MGYKEDITSKARQDIVKLFSDGNTTVGIRKSQKEIPEQSKRKLKSLTR